MKFQQFLSVFFAFIIKNWKLDSIMLKYLTVSKCAIWKIHSTLSFFLVKHVHVSSHCQVELGYLVMDEWIEEIPKAGKPVGGCIECPVQHCAIETRILTSNSF